MHFGTAQIAKLDCLPNWFIDHDGLQAFAAMTAPSLLRGMVAALPTFTGYTNPGSPGTSRLPDRWI
jgi:hypothetical protein